LALSTDPAAARGSVALMVKVLDRPEPCWWQVGDVGVAGALHRTLSNALQREGVPVLAPRDPGAHAVPKGGGAPGDEIAAALARSLGAGWALAGAAQAQPVGAPAELGLKASKVELSVRLLHPDRGRAAATLLSARGWAEEAPVARQQASELVAERLALWLAAQLAAAPPSEVANTKGLRVRGLGTARELRDLVRKLRSAVGVYWLAGAAAGEVRLTGRGPAPEPAAITEALSAPPFDRYAVSVSRDGEGLLVEFTRAPGGPTGEGDAPSPGAPAEVIPAVDSSPSATDGS